MAETTSAPIVKPTKPPAVGFEMPKFEMLKFDMPKVEMPAAFRELAERGFRRILIEGGTQTLSRFLGARCLDRLHILVAPILLGGGRPSISLPPLQRIGDAARIAMRAFSLDACASAGAPPGAHTDVLLDCDLSAQRIPIGRANMSR